MASFIDENTQFVDTNGKPLVDGSLYVGENSFDPILNPITIYSDRELTIVLANPQTLDSSGRSTNKIWIPGRYSFRVDDENDVQKLIDLDAGQTAESGVTSLAEIQGTNDITAEASTTITSYVDKELYVYNSVNENTGPVTLDIDNVGVTPVKKNHDQDIEASDFQADMIVIVVRNELDDTFEWVNQNLTTVHWTKGADIISATSLPLINDGNYSDVTGTTTITSFASIGVGTVKKLHFDDELILTHNATILILPGADDITTAAGDEAEFIEYAANSFICTNYSKADGTALVSAGESGLSNIIAPHETLTASYVTSTTVDIDAGGILLRTTDRDSFFAESVDLTLDITVSGLNGLDTGTEAASTWYYLWVIYNGTTVAGLLSISPTAPTLPSGYTYQGIIGAVYNDSVSNFDLFEQVGHRISTQITTVVSSGSVASYTFVSLAVAVPANATKATGYMGSDNPANASVDVASTSFPLGTIRQQTAASSVVEYSPYTIALVETQAFYYKVNAGTTDAFVQVTGWEF